MGLQKMTVTHVSLTLKTTSFIKINAFKHALPKLQQWILTVKIAKDVKHVLKKQTYVLHVKSLNFQIFEILNARKTVLQTFQFKLETNVCLAILTVKLVMKTYQLVLHALENYFSTWILNVKQPVMTEHTVMRIWFVNLVTLHV